MKKILSCIMAFILALGLMGCNKDSEPVVDNDSNSGQTDNSTNDNTNSDNNSNQTPEFPVDDSKTTIFLAGDSTVKTYNDNQYIGGWGQYLDLFLNDKVTVKNCAQGGRSSRSFINEGRLYDISDGKYTFSENDGNSIGDEIKEGDYLFIQFGHNDDDTKKASSYSTLYDRMVPLGKPDSNGIYPTTAGTKSPNTYLPSEYTSNVSSTSSALATIAKYGSSYYAYDCGGTYKWFLKQYIDFAREKGATPVLVTPVARVKFSGDEIIGGAGLHGANFAYVKAVRQLAEEEDCLLIDLFADSKKMLETATSTYANFLMAIKPNDLTGEWPLGFDSSYNNLEAGYESMEATHYNKYGAYLQAGYVAKTILASITAKETHKDNKEAFKFVNHILSTPESYVDPSNLIPVNTVAKIEELLGDVKVTNPNRTYKEASEVVNAITELISVEITNDNYLAREAEVAKVKALYHGLNVDYRANVSNYDSLTAYEATIDEFIFANKPKPISTVRLDISSLAATAYEANQTCGIYTIYASTAKPVTVKSGNISFTHNYESLSVAKYLDIGGTAQYGSGRYVGFTTTGACSVTIVAKSKATDERTIKLVSSSDTSKSIETFSAGSSTSVTTKELDAAGTYYVSSASSGVYLYDIIIEYYD